MKKLIILISILSLISCHTTKEIKTFGIQNETFVQNIYAIRAKLRGTTDGFGILTFVAKDDKQKSEEYKNIYRLIRENDAHKELYAHLTNDDVIELFGNPFRKKERFSLLVYDYILQRPYCNCPYDVRKESESSFIFAFSYDTCPSLSFFFDSGTKKLSEVWLSDFQPNWYKEDGR